MLPNYVAQLCCPTCNQACIEPSFMRLAAVGLWQCRVEIQFPGTFGIFWRGEKNPLLQVTMCQMCAKRVPNDASFIIDFWIRLVASLPGLSQVLAIADVSSCFFAETTVYGFIFAQRNMTSNDPRNHKSTHFQTGFKNPPPPCRLAVTPGSRLCHSRLMLSEEGCNEKRNGHVWGEDPEEFPSEELNHVGPLGAAEVE